jgi:hypothetical protein
MTAREIIYACLNLAKLTGSDDAVINEDLVFFLCKKYRTFLIKKEKDKEKAQSESVETSEYQQICLDLEKVPAIDGDPCTGGYYLRSVQEVPSILEGTTPQVYPADFYQGINISFVPKERMRFVGTNKFLQNIIYVSLGADKHIYLNSSNPQFFYLRQLRMNAAFEDIEKAADLLCDDECNCTACDWMDMEFPMREHLVPVMIELVVKDLLGTKYQPIDWHNNASDDHSQTSATPKAS